MEGAGPTLFLTHILRQQTQQTKLIINLLSRTAVSIILMLGSSRTCKLCLIDNKIEHRYITFRLAIHNKVLDTLATTLEKRMII